MTKAPDKRTDSASRVIKATAQTLYNAFLSPQAVAAWRPPDGMRCEIYTFDAKVGGGYRMSFIYRDDSRGQGKTSANADVIKGCFAELVPGKRIVELVEFESDGAEFAGTMKITTTFTPVTGGTKVTFICEDVPLGIKEEDHAKGMTSTLENLAAFTEE